MIFQIQTWCALHHMSTSNRQCVAFGCHSYLNDLNPGVSIPLDPGKRAAALKALGRDDSFIEATTKTKRLEFCRSHLLHAEDHSQRKKLVFAPRKQLSTSSSAFRESVVASTSLKKGPNNDDTLSLKRKHDEDSKRDQRVAVRSSSRDIRYQEELPSLLPTVGELQSRFDFFSLTYSLLLHDCCTL